MSEPIAYYHRTYDETMALLIEARNYAAFHHETHQRDIAPAARLFVSYESLRVTSRLSQVMAWLLAQKAVDAREISAEHGTGEAFALLDDAASRDPLGPENPMLPSGLRNLLARSHSLYLRVLRLEAQARRNCRQRAAM